MTDNIEKLYELAKAVKYRAVSKHNLYVYYGDYDNLDDVMKYDDGFDIEKIYPPFTDTKQLELIKWLVLKIGNITIYPNPENEFFLTCIFKGGNSKDFSQALAGLVCGLWEDLTDTQREEIKGILQ